ncbi:unnamed protein product [Brassicogethes aeneus]|uniref:Major facilitator superfamily (MFS) profile domain-containing protein n=1 Tax=Brassicogethes aeneus TaxID=1431903 RepID=A0A9P0FI81_BRAAE|nr:unnamed protein product [Brassicogethes aeneus]
MLTTMPKQLKKVRQYVVATLVSFGALCAGSVLAWTAPALPQILIPEFVNASTHENITGAPGFRISEQEGALVGSMLTIGALVSALPVGILADKMGRRFAILSLSFTFLLHWILIVFSCNVEMVVVGRFFAGMGLGGVCVVVPMYVGEIAEASSRGILGAFFNLFLCGGMLSACTIGAVSNWVGLSIALSLFPVIFGVSYFFIPETPSFLCEKNRLEEAEDVLKDLRGENVDVQDELNQIQKGIEESRENSSSFADIISNTGNIKAIVAVCGILAYQQLCGINAVVFYLGTIFKAAGSTLSPSIAGIIITSVQLVVSYLFTFIIERANRRFYLMSSSAGMLLSLATLGMFFHLKNIGIDVTHIGFLPICSTIVFVTMFSIGYGPIPWLLLGELFSPEIKGFGSGIAVVINWIAAFLVTFFFPIINSSLGSHVAFYILTTILASATFFVYFFVPETRGKTLTEIQEELNK